MIITPEERRKVLEVFQNAPPGLSITEIARRSGLNRNKSSLIASELCKNEILCLSQKGTCKIFSLKTPIAFRHLIDSIPDPVFIVNDEFSVIAINKAYSQVFKVDPEETAGISGDALLKPPYRDLSEDLKRDCRHEENGKKTVHTDATGSPLCTTFSVPGTGQRPLFIIILHPDNRTRTTRQIRELVRKTETNFSTSIAEILDEKNWSDALARIAEMAHASLSDTLIFTITTDNETKTGRIHPVINSVHPPRAGASRSGFSRILNETVKQIPDTTILVCKTGQPICYRQDGGNNRQKSMMPPGIEAIFRETNVSSLVLVGISTGTSLTAIIGIGSFSDDIDPEVYTSLLTTLSGYLILIRTVYDTANMKRENEREYQKRYSDVYSLLAEKSEEILHLTIETEHLRSILGSVLQKLQISLIVTTPGGDLITANKTAVETCNIEEQDLAEGSSLENCLSSELAKTLRDLIARDRNGEKRSESAIHEVNQRQVHWYLVRLKRDRDAPCIFIGEEAPAPLIAHLISVQKDGVYIPGQGIIL